jgi:hypothetical protein
MTEKYNGWANYETWRVKLEIFDNTPISDYSNCEDEFDPSMICAYTLSDALKERAEYYIEESSQEGLARDYALAFLENVDWREIAQHMIADWVEESK